MQRPVLDAVDAVAHRFELNAPQVLMHKVGPKLYVEVDTVADADVTIGQQQEVRDELRRQLDTLPYEVWLNVELAPRSADTGTAGP